MGRPSKLTEKQWAAIGERLLNGEKAAGLSREFDVSKAAISARFSKRIETVKAVANQLVSADYALKALPIAEQIQAVSIADRLRAMSMHLMDGATAGAATYSKLSSMAQVQAETLPAGGSDDGLKAVMALTRTANAAAEVPMALLVANRDAVKALDAPVAGDQSLPGRIDDFV